MDFAKQKEIVLTCNITQDFEVKADLQMLNTILRNLISNGIKFTNKGGKVDIGYELKEKSRQNLEDTNQENKYIEVCVRDTGIGMEQDLLDDLFRIDEQTTRKGTEGELSTGLGLLLCKDFIEKHGGRIWADSEEGKGSTFYFALNLKNNA